MNPIKALNVLAIATEPGFKPQRLDYVNIQTALEVLKTLVEAQPNAKIVEPPPPDSPPAK